MVSLARSRTFRLAVAAGAAALLVAGCSASAATGANSGSTGTTTATLTAAEAVNLAAAHAQKATSFTGTISVQSTGADLGSVRIAGTISETTRPSLLVEAELPTVNVSGMSFSGGMSEILTSSTLYLKMSALSSLTGKPWAEAQLSDLKVGGVSFGQLMQQVQGDSPLTQTQLLAHANDVRKVGTGTLNGVPVTEYSGSYSIPAALAQAHGISTAQLRQQLASYGFTTADFQVWLDDQQQARKLIVTELGSKGNITLTMTVTSINQPVNVQLPPASQVAVIPASVLQAGSALQSGS